MKATYKYVKEDVDELSFEVGDTIQVIEYDDPEDQVLLVYFYCINLIKEKEIKQNCNQPYSDCPKFLKNHLNRTLSL